MRPCSDGRRSPGNRTGPRPLERPDSSGTTPPGKSGVIETCEGGLRSWIEPGRDGARPASREGGQMRGGPDLEKKWSDPGTPGAGREWEDVSSPWSVHGGRPRWSGELGRPRPPGGHAARRSPPPRGRTTAPFAPVRQAGVHPGAGPPVFPSRPLAHDCPHAVTFWSGGAGSVPKVRWGPG